MTSSTQQVSESQRCTLPDGATLVYDVFGVEHLSKGKVPLVMIVGRGCLRSDWEPLFPSIYAKRPVLVFDNRGIGDSTYSTPERNDELTIEMMARDAVALIEHIGWKNVDILGFSMGGVILQQLLLLPTHATEPTPLPFRVHHAILSATLCIPIKRPANSHAQAPPSSSTPEQRKTVVRPLVDLTLDPKWRAEHQARYEYILDRIVKGSRPARTVMRQETALLNFNFRSDLIRIPSSIKVLVLHGTNDLIVPYAYCEEILAALPHAKRVEVGKKSGQVPSLEFGHGWFEYFNVEVWMGVLEAFLDDEDEELLRGECAAQRVGRSARALL